MHKVMMALAVFAMGFVVGCGSPESEYEDLIREAGKLMKVSASEIDEQVAEEMKKFKDASKEKQQEMLEEGRKAVEGIKALKKLAE